MLKAICDVQTTILASPRGMTDKEECFDSKMKHLQSLEERDAISTLELKKSLWELLIPPE